MQFLGIKVITLYLKEKNKTYLIFKTVYLKVKKKYIKFFDPFFSITILYVCKKNTMKLAFGILFLLFVCNTYSQTLHHQMISSQGGNAVTNSGIVVKYTIGQQSVTGTKTGNVIVQQGFQQSNWDKIISKNEFFVNTTTFPNPYVDIINFQFSQSIGENVSLLVYDVLGRQVYSNTLQVFDNKTSVNLQELQSAEYFVQLSNNTFTYHTKIIKN